jgi:hypothetical protein
MSKGAVTGAVEGRVAAHCCERRWGITADQPRHEREGRAAMRDRGLFAYWKSDDVGGGFCPPGMLHMGACPLLHQFR